MIPNKIFTIFSWTLLALLPAYTYSASLPQVFARIIGGKPAAPSAWPWMTGLVHKHPSINNDLFCGASLIAKNWVLTAAHCVINKSTASFDVIINQVNLDSLPSERLTVERMIIHPLFDNFSLKNDLALIKLKSSSNTQSILVLPPFSFQDKAGKSAIALGWGTTSSNSLEYTTELQQVSLPLINNALCKSSMHNITDDMLCAGDGLGHKDTCSGDSGGPLIVFDDESQTWRQAGITSWGFKCAAAGSYGVYTRLKNYASFISEHICSEEAALPIVSLKLHIDGNIASAQWNTLNNISGYRLNYAPYPDALTIYNIDMNNSHDLSVDLGTGSAYYVAISSYRNNCLSDYSNIEHFIIK